MSQVQTENRLQGFGEELANSVSQGIGAVLAIIVAPILIGGAAYTIGVIFFVLDARLPYAYFILRLFVLLGTVFHFIAWATQLKAGRYCNVSPNSI